VVNLLLAIVLNALLEPFARKSPLTSPFVETTKDADAEAGREDALALLVLFSSVIGVTVVSFAFPFGSSLPDLDLGRSGSEKVLYEKCCTFARSLSSFFSLFSFPISCNRNGLIQSRSKEISFR
jgi:hypothetical protein